VSELEKFFLLPWAAFKTCDLLQWWAGHFSQFLNLSRFAHDIISIPGMFQMLVGISKVLKIILGSSAGIKRISSGGRDTILLCRANLKPDRP
jgi:hAT family C-terminal dimerisation region